MEIIFTLTVMTLRLILATVMMAMFLRAVLSFLPTEEGAIHSFLALITEPFILPVRILFDKLGIDFGIPLDIPFFVTSILLAILALFI
ncbi:MAG: YggT family protein [Clostridia bacterium]|nr:YggT family protein [Clostridia bacterium]